MAIRFIENNQWITVDNITQIYSLFIGVPGNFRIQPRTAPITLEDGTVIDKVAAIKGLLLIAIQNFLDNTAKEYGYDSIYTAALRAGFAGPYQAEGTKFAMWMDRVWRLTTEQINLITADSTNIPTAETLIASVPTYVQFSA